jgi:hypothetical protein
MATMHDRQGGHSIELLIPFEHQGRKIEAIQLKPFLFDHTLRWQRGAFPTSLSLLAALTGENEGTLRLLRYPDVDRVLAQMMAMAPAHIRDAIYSGQIPEPREPPPAPPQPEEPAAPEEAFAGLNDAAE